MTGVPGNRRRSAGLVAARILCALLLGAVALPMRAASAQDGEKRRDVIVYTENGERKERRDVVVKSATQSEIKFESNGRESKMSGKNVDLILWGDAPPEYQVGWRALGRREGTAAKSAFEAVLNAKAADIITGDWVDEFAYAGLGEAFVLLGEFDKALGAFDKSAKANAKSILAGRVLTGMVDAALGKKDTAGAVKHADALAAAGRAGGRSDWELDAHFLKAQIHMSSGNTSAATQAYGDAARLAGQQAASAKDPITKAKFESHQRTAAAAEGWVLVNKGVKSKSQADLDKATQFFSGLAAKFGEQDEILSASENAQGVIKFARDDPAGALQHFQAVEVLYFSSPSEVARSLYYQSRCWDKLGNAALKSARERDLKEYFPKSEWARKLD